MIEALELYTGELYERIEGVAKAASGPREAVLAVMHVVSCTERPDHGCFFINSVTELLPKETQVFGLARQHLAKVDKLVRGLLRKAGFSTQAAASRSGAMLALAAGAVALRKAGESEARILTMLDLLPALMCRPDIGTRRRPRPSNPSSFRPAPPPCSWRFKRTMQRFSKSPLYDRCV